MPLRCLSRWVLLGSLVLGITSCSEGGPVGLSTEAVRSGSTAMCTYAPADWRARCDAGLGQTSRCAALRSATSDDDRELAALDLNLWSSASGRTGGGLGDLHFGYGTRLQWSLDDVLRLTRRDADAQLRAAVRDANRAFSDCFDARVAVPWVETPICGTSSRGARDRVSGPETARCVALDGDCRRGRYDATLGCCGETEMPTGAVCGEEAVDDQDEHGCHAGHHHGPRSAATGQVCNLVGQCVAESEVPMSERALGEALWVEPVRIDGEWEAPMVWHLDTEASDGGTIEVRVGDQPIAIVPASAENHRVRVASSREGALGIVTVDLVNDDGSAPRSLYVPRRISQDVDLEGGETYDVCAAFGRFDDQPTLLPDCTGGQIVTCPSVEGAAITCTIDPRGYSLVTAPALAVAWERAVTPEAMALAGAIPPPSDNPGDAGFDGGRDAGRDSGLGIIRAIGMFEIIGAGRITPVGPRITPGGGATIRPCPSASCSTACGGTGTRVCVNGALGPCISLTAERCNGVDDNCDGRVDENPRSLCNDGILCTGDVCRGTQGCFFDRGADGSGAVSSTGGSFAGCRGWLAGTRTCVTPLCAPALIVTPPTDTFAPATPDANGCQFVFGNNFCTNTWDRCVCNGSEACLPTAAGADPVTGCLSPPRFSPPTFAPGSPSIIHDPCDADGDPCTDERVCCERLECRLINPSNPRADSDFRICDDVPAVSGIIGVVTRSTGTADGQTASCIPYDLPGRSPLDPSGMARTRVCPLDGFPCTVPPVGGMCNLGVCSDEIDAPGPDADGRAPTAPRDEAYVSAGVMDLPFPLPDLHLPAVGGGPLCTLTTESPACSHMECDGMGGCAPANRGPFALSGPVVPVPGCNGLINEGCAIRGCDTTSAVGACISAPTAAALAFRPSSECDGPWGFGSCYTRSCAPSGSTGLCIGALPLSTLCEDLADCGRTSVCQPLAARLFTSIVPIDDQSGFTVGCAATAGCNMGDRCIAEGTFSYAGSCQVCIGAMRSDGFSDIADGEGCTFAPGRNGTCLSGACCSGGMCVPPVSP